MEGRREKEDRRMEGRKRGKENDNVVFQLSIDTFKNNPKTMVSWVATLFSSNMMDEMVEFFFPIPVILGYRYHRDFSWTGSSRWYSHRTNSGATALSRLSRDHWSQSVALCVVSLGTLCSSQHDCWVSRSRNHPFSLGMGPETWECHIHILCISWTESTVRIILIEEKETEVLPLEVERELHE